MTWIIHKIVIYPKGNRANKKKIPMKENRVLCKAVKFFFSMRDYCRVLSNYFNLIHDAGK